MPLDTIVESLSSYQPKKIILFGSHVRGTAGPESDIDIAIIKNTSARYHDRLIEVRRLIRSTLPVDVFVFTEEEMESHRETNPIIREILRTGKVIYAN